MAEKQPQGYKTEEELKREARERKVQEDKLAAARPKTQSQKKRENFWYHYKWHTIIAVVLVITGAFFIKDTVFRTMPDATVIMVSSSYIMPESIEKISSAIEEKAEDFNGDGKVYILIDSIMVDSGEQGMQDMAGQMKLSAVFAAGSEPIFLLDEASHRYIVQLGEAGEDSAGQEMFLSDSLPLEKLGEFGDEFSGMRFYLRFFPKTDEHYEYCENLLKAIAQ